MRRPMRMTPQKADGKRQTSHGESQTPMKDDDLNTLWSNVKAELKQQLGPDTFQNWIAPLTLTSIKDREARFEVPTRFLGNWVMRNWGEAIQASMNLQGLKVEKLNFEITEKTAKSQGSSGKKTKSLLQPSSKDGRPGALKSSKLDARFTFDRFVVGKPNELAHAAARAVALGEPTNFNPLFLYGGVALGKTHLMHAIAWELRISRPNAKVMYLSAEQFMYQFVQALRLRNTMDFKELFRSVDVLMVDDVQFIAGKDSTQEEFFHTFNALVDQNKQVIITADRAPGEINGLEERIKSRLQWGLMVDVHPTDYELRLGILQSKTESRLKDNPDVIIREGVLEFVAHRISTHVRALEGALTRLFAFATLVGREISLDLAQECLSDMLRSSERKISVDEIIRKVADHYNVRLSDILGPRRSRNVARPRQVAMFLAKKLTTKSLPEIGKRFGNRDHTTVIHAVKKIDELRAYDHQIADDVEMLRRTLEA